VKPREILYYLAEFVCGLLVLGIPILFLLIVAACC
jgi:hypothetical protein